MGRISGQPAKLKPQSIPERYPGGHDFRINLRGIFTRIKGVLPPQRRKITVTARFFTLLPQKIVGAPMRKGCAMYAVQAKRVVIMPMGQHGKIGLRHPGA